MCEALANMLERHSDPGELYELLGLDQDSVPVKDYGRERGADPKRTELQVKAVGKLASKINAKAEGDDDHAQFDVLSKPRVILFEGKVNKRSLNSVVQHTIAKRLILFNDCIVVATEKSSSFSTSEALTVNAVMPLDEIFFTPYIDDAAGGEELNTGFEIATTERPFHLLVDSESEKRVWCDEIDLAIRAYITEARKDLSPGWQHMSIRGTLLSAAMRGTNAEVTRHIGTCYRPAEPVFYRLCLGSPPLFNYNF
jgi:hypothetical protein